MNVGDIIDRKYELVRLIGKGGMGSVWEVRHTRTKQRLALKLLLSEMENESAAIDRFIQESQAAAAIGHLEIFGKGGDRQPDAVPGIVDGRADPPVGRQPIHQRPHPIARPDRIGTAFGEMGD